LGGDYLLQVQKLTTHIHVMSRVEIGENLPPLKHFSTEKYFLNLGDIFFFEIAI
jgi:hypothetical protein